MIKQFKLFEELKRKPKSLMDSRDFFVDEDNEFTYKEKTILEKDDFEIVNNVATNVDIATFVIKKIYNEDYIVYELTVTDKEGKIKTKKFKSVDYLKRYDLLNSIIDICAAIKDDIKRSAHRHIDPYDEENWDEQDTKIKNDEIIRQILLQQQQAIRRLGHPGRLDPMLMPQRVLEEEERRQRRLQMDREIEEMRMQEMGRAVRVRRPNVPPPPVDPPPPPPVVQPEPEPVEERPYEGEAQEEEGLFKKFLKRARGSYNPLKWED
jgi:hypothetical protein